ncbi:hypothetical protein M231_00984 [Tremella mesenterica]|uniref:Uncharacterized protein n=1 Tax=Tremella mesenterica TaxID=5217 RepID=A0A4Q1BUG3_TREME|nr:uncharacterized protein TREMEDRAFT_61613 [Tremella mesenterica DSM 1558]EIW69843.1 hypothetical protein TREMEDRAFT_61613 [Tremella mesenterica DSM 1558]RXK41749.1 hypothetical protein M231_00984 [Tremella mesenterica]
MSDDNNNAQPMPSWVPEDAVGWYHHPIEYVESRAPPTSLTYAYGQNTAAAAHTTVTGHSEYDMGEGEEELEQEEDEMEAGSDEMEDDEKSDNTEEFEQAFKAYSTLRGREVEQLRSHLDNAKQERSALINELPWGILPPEVREPTLNTVKETYEDIEELLGTYESQVNGGLDRGRQYRRANRTLDQIKEMYEDVFQGVRLEDTDNKIQESLRCLHLLDLEETLGQASVEDATSEGIRMRCGILETAFEHQDIGTFMMELTGTNAWDQFSGEPLPETGEGNRDQWWQIMESVEQHRRTQMDTQ